MNSIQEIFTDNINRGFGNQQTIMIDDSPLTHFKVKHPGIAHKRDWLEIIPEDIIPVPTGDITYTMAAELVFTAFGAKQKMFIQRKKKKLT